jgi:hypothetical protein
MDYSDINNLLGNLELDRPGHNHKDTPLTFKKDTPLTFKKDTPLTLQNGQQHVDNQSKFKKKTKSDTENINLSLNRNIQLMNDIGGNRVNLETINPQRNLVFNSKNSNTNFSTLEQERNQQMHTHNNKQLHIIDYNLFSDNYKNRDNIEQDDINNKLGNRENTPNISITSTQNT